MDRPVQGGVRVQPTVTIRDIARMANVSVTTVSNLVNGRLGHMRATTRRRVEQVIAKYDFCPNAAAQMLRTGRARVLALVVPSVANPFWGALSWHVERCALQYGYHVMVCNSERDPAREVQYVSALWRAGVRDVVLAASEPALDHLRKFLNRGLNLVAFDRRAEPDDPPSVVSLSMDNHRGSFMAVQHLLTLGHRRVAFLSGPLRTAARMERFRGYRDAMAAAGVDVASAWVWTGGSTKGAGDAKGAELGRLGALTLIARRPRPTALFAANDIYALGAYAATRELRLAIPRDLSIVGFDDIILARLANPPLTTVRQPLRAIAEAAVTQLIGRAQGLPDATWVSRVVPPRLVLRASTSAAARNGMSSRAFTIQDQIGASTSRRRR